MASASGIIEQPPTAGPARFLEGRPEEKLINDIAVLQATTRKVAVALAYLSLTWSTVVLLGGFVSVLKLIDFWFLTAISAAFAVNLPDVFEYKIAFLYAAARLYIGVHDLGREFSSRGHALHLCLAVSSMLAEACIGAVVMVLYTGIQILVLTPLFAILLASRRLVVGSYGDAGGDDANAAKLKASLQIFYFLALAQNVLVCIWSSFLLTRNTRIATVSRQCGFEKKWGVSLVKRYLRETTTIRATEGYVPLTRNLVSFAVTLLGSESLRDRRSAVRLLDTFVRNKIPVGPNLLPTKDGLENLMELVEVGNCEIRERSARVVVALADDLHHIDHFPTALEYIASLLQASDRFPTTATCRRSGMAAAGRTTTTSLQENEAGWKRWRNGPVYWSILAFVSRLDKPDDDFPYGGPKQLVSQGLLIIERLALHQGNCGFICSNHGLLSRITAPLDSHVAFLPDAEYDTEWTDILSRSLRIVARLISAPGQACRELRNEIASKTQAVANLTRILEEDRFSPVLKAAAIEILAELASDKTVTGLAKGDIKKFIGRMWGIFLAEMDGNNTIEEDKDQQEATRLMRHKAGEALARMLAVWDDAGAGISSSDILEMSTVQSTGSAELPAAKLLRHVVGQLTDMLITNRGSRTIAAEILVHFCSHFTRHRELPRLEVIEMLTKVLQLMIQRIPRPANNRTGVRANNSHAAAQNDVENPRPAPEDHTGSRSSSIENKVQQQEEKEFVVALLSLAVVVCDRIIDAQDFTFAASGDIVAVLVTKLKDIIESTNDTAVECLSAVKLSCQLIVLMVHLKPSCIEVFMEHNFKHVLTKALETFSDLDNCLLFDADYHQVTKTEKPLASLVKQAQDLLLSV